MNHSPLKLRYTIQCDSCAAEYEQVGGRAVYRWQRDNCEVVNRMLSDDGWRVDGDRHICPDCITPAR